MGLYSLVSLALLICRVSAATSFSVPSSPPSTAVVPNPNLVGVSIEFFTWPAYTNIAATSNCLSNIQSLRGTPAPIRIGGTTQDRATYDASLSAAVSYTVASPADAPASLTYGPSFFTLAASHPNNITVGLNRQLNNQANSLSAAEKAKSTIPNLYAIELGNEPDLYSTSSPIATGGKWSVSLDSSSQSSWFSSMAGSLGNSAIFQAGVYISNSWPLSTTLSTLKSSSAINFVKSFSRHSYPQSACGGASTNLQTLMSHSGIVSYMSTYSSEAKTIKAAGKSYFLGETNSATCGGGGISPTFGAGLWIVDYVLQAAMIGVDRLYFHQGTIGNCAYCWWTTSSTAAPYYGAAFVSEFLGTDGVKLAMLDDGKSAIAAYAVYNSAGKPVRVLVYNSAYFASGTASTSAITLSGLSATQASAKRMTAASATATSGATIGKVGFAANCESSGAASTESLAVSAGALSVSVRASEAVIVSLS